MSLLSSLVVGMTRTGRPYHFSYQVEDEREGLQYGAVQDSDGRVVTGQYTVLLPGGRTDRALKRSDHITSPLTIT